MGRPSCFISLVTQMNNFKEAKTRRRAYYCWSQSWACRGFFAASRCWSVMVSDPKIPLQHLPVISCWLPVWRNKGVECPVLERKSPLPVQCSGGLHFSGSVMHLAVHLGLFPCFTLIALENQELMGNSQPGSQNQSQIQVNLVLEISLPL